MNNPPQFYQLFIYSPDGRGGRKTLSGGIDKPTMELDLIVHVFTEDGKNRIN